METITTASFTLVALLLYAIGRVNVQQIFDRDPYESRRTAMKGSRLLKVLVFYQLLAAPSARGLVDAIEDSLDAQAALGGTVARNTLSNALSQRDLEQMIEGRDVPARSLQSLPSEDGQEVRADCRSRCQFDQTLFGRLQLGELSREDRRRQNDLRPGLDARRAESICLHGRRPCS